MIEEPAQKPRFRIALRIVFYGALLAAAAYVQPAVRCFYNPFQEKSVVLPCFAASQLAVLPAPQQASALFILAQERLGAGDFETAIGAGEKALILDASQHTKDQFVSIVNGVGDTLMARKQFVAAVPIFSRALEILPTNRQALNQRGYAHQNMKQFDEAAADYGAMITRDPSDKAGYINRAGVYRELRRYSEMVEDLSTFIKLGGKDVWAWSARSYARLQLKDDAGAIEDADATFALDPKDKSARETKTQALINLSKYDEALVAVDQWEQAVGASSTVSEDWRATILQKQGRNLLAMEALDRAIAIDAHDAWAFRMRGYIRFYGLGDPNHARDDIERAIALGDATAVTYKQKMWPGQSADEGVITVDGQDFFVNEISARDETGTQHAVKEIDENARDHFVGGKREKFDAQVQSCEHLVDVPAGENHSYGGVCMFTQDGVTRRAMVCGDEMVGHFHFKDIGDQKPSTTELGIYTASNCVGG